MSLDEAYLDITPVVKERNLPPEVIAEEIRERIFKETQLTCSAGIAVNGFLAKVCSGIYVLYSDNQDDYNE